MGIRGHTIERWGPQPAKAYLQTIRIAIDHAAANPSQRRHCDERSPVYFFARVGSHVVFYREVGETIRVERILHERMNFEAHI
jgi:toxin ParE1/3/4